MRPQRATDSEIAALAAEQHGVVSRSQLLVRGLTKESVARRVRAGRLHVVHRGVYAVGHRVLTREGRWMAATLATGGVLSHVTAATAWGFAKSAGAIHVTVPGDPGRKRRAGVKVHRSRTLKPADTTVKNGIPITEPHRTLADLATTLSGRPLEHAVNLAERLIDFERLAQTASPSLQAVLRTYATADTRSALEEAFLKLCDDHRIPRPRTNTLVEGILCDFVWSEQRLIVEVDGYKFHRAPTVFESDRERDVTLTALGWRVLRFTWRQLTERPAWVAAKIRLAWRTA
jgi:very-short-patch-repair endonuclease